MNSISGSGAGQSARRAQFGARRHLCPRRGGAHHQRQRRQYLFHGAVAARAHRHLEEEHRGRQAHSGDHPGEGHQRRFFQLELAQQTAILAGVEAQIPALEEQEREARYALAILLGRVPEGMDVSADSLEGIVAPPVEPGMPSPCCSAGPTSLRPKPSCLRARQRRRGARRLPAGDRPDRQWRLQRRPDFQSVQSQQSGLERWRLAAAGHLRRRRLTSQRDLAKAQEVELIASYRSTVLNALSDVESALGSASSLDEPSG